MTKNKKAAARIANYFGYEKVSDYIDFLDKKAGTQSTAKPAQSTTGKLDKALEAFRKQLKREPTATELQKIKAKYGS